LARNLSSNSISPFSEAEMQRRMNDPEYAQQMAAKYNSMSETEKANMVKNQLAIKGTNVNHSEFEKLSKDNRSSKNTIDINLFVGETTSKLSSAF